MTTTTRKCIYGCDDDCKICPGRSRTLPDLVDDFSKEGWHITDIEKCKDFISDICLLFANITSEIALRPSENTDTNEKEACLEIIQKYLRTKKP